MKRRVVWTLGAALLMLSGCGTVRQAHPISHGMSPTEVKNEVLARVRGWRAVKETFTEVFTTPRHQSTVYRVKLVAEADPTRFRLEVTPSTGQPYEVIDNGLNTIVYQAGAKHYSVLTDDPDSLTEFRILGTNFPQVIQSSQAKSVDVTSKEVVLHLVSPVTAHIMAKTTLWFSLMSNTPIKWQSTWPGGTLTETPTRMAINPAVSSTAFNFTPPAGVTPEVALTQQGTELDLVRDEVSFPIVLPPENQNLALEGVNVGREAQQRVVLLTYNTPSGSPVVITESRGLPFKAPAGVSMVSEAVGLTTVKVGVLPDGDEIGVLTLDKTLLVVEGPTTVVDGLINAWANASPSSLPNG
ncbi:MAG: hypothetical protein OWU84_04875 [Firmicutes bacterium]|nr:hypothetical protein [Bacillota bacterium]